MKYLILLLTALAALLLLGGCGEQNEASSSALPAGTEIRTEMTTEIESSTRAETPSTEPPEPVMDQLGDPEQLLALPASPYAEHVYSHRGTALEEEPETFAAYDLAVSYGSRYLEQDLRMSADGVLYCSDAASPEALTGEARAFSDMKAEEIDRLRTVPGGQCIPRLEAVFARYGTAVHYLVELSSDREMLLALLELVERTDMAGNVILQASSFEMLREAEQKYPDMRKLYLCFRQESFDDALTEDCVDIIGVSGKLVSAGNCRRVHDAGKQFNVYVVNRASSIRAVIELGADSYFTDYTAKAFVLEALYRD